MAEVQCLLYEYEDLNLDPQHTCNKLHQVPVTAALEMGRQEDHLGLFSVVQWGEKVVANHKL